MHVSQFNGTNNRMVNLLQRDNNINEEQEEDEDNV